MGCCKEAVAALAEAVLGAEGAEGSLTIAFVDETAIAELNLRYRGLGQPTDVLAFAEADAGDPWPDLFPGDPWPDLFPGERWPDLSSGDLPELGELALCLPVILRYAEEDDVEAGRQLGWTIIHGILHLLKYDHERDEGEMRHREQALLEELGPAVETIPLPPHR